MYSIAQVFFCIAKPSIKIVSNSFDFLSERNILPITSHTSIMGSKYLPFYFIQYEISRPNQRKAKNP